VNKQSIYDLTIDELKSYLLSCGEPKYRAQQIFSLLHKGVVVKDLTNIPKPLREKLEQDFYAELPKIVGEQVATDGTKKFLLELHDGLTIECVLLQAEYGQTVCVSTQVGCKMRCAFCLSGRNGFVRNLSAGEILAQIFVAAGVIEKKSNKESTLRVVLMGSGEPLDNFDNVWKFVRLVNDKEGINISTRNISLSTVGLASKIREFADLQSGVNLCISLHAPNDEIRRKIMPVAKKYPIGELMDSAKYFFQKTGRRVIFEYCLIENMNCSVDNARELAKLVKGFPTHVNLILLNSTGGNMNPPSRATAMKFMDALIKEGVSCTFRKSKGDDIMAACGQLKGQN